MKKLRWEILLDCEPQFCFNCIVRLTKRKTNYCAQHKSGALPQGLERNGVSSGEGGAEGPGPPSRAGDRHSTPSKEGGNMEQEEEGRTGQA